MYLYFLLQPELAYIPVHNATYALFYEKNYPAMQYFRSLYIIYKGR